MNFFKIKFIFTMVKKVNNCYEFLWEKSYISENLPEEINGITINYNLYFYRKGLKIYYFIEQTEGQILPIEQDNVSALTTLTDLIVNKAIIKQLSSNLDKSREKLITKWLIIGLIIGCVLGGSIGYAVGIG